ncbi:hypothetical protein PYK79_47515 [Streptomyces sp. ID05-04B]|nr:hypothetical protein [Streptomyces sp. ID05-04B]MDX5569395.1 hypothetical protein [Streptomyces sp. ID05-04B]
MISSTASLMAVPYGHPQASICWEAMRLARRAPRGVELNMSL